MRKRRISLLLVLLMLLQLVPAQALGIGETPEEASGAPMPSSETVMTDEATPTATVSEEVSELREADVKHFRMSDGGFVAVQYKEPVHYLTTAGEWKEIDNSLELKSADGREVYTAQAGEVRKSFAAKAGDGDLLTVEVGEYSVSMAPLRQPDAELPVQPGGDAELMVSEPEKATDATVTNPAADEWKGLTAAELKTPAKLSSEITYEDVYDGVDLMYRNSGYDVKESIVVNKRSGSYEYAFLLKAEKLDVRLCEDGSISLSGDDGTEVFCIPAPYMIDASGAVSADASYELAETDGGCAVRVTASKEWMNAEERAYPVVIDPTLKVKAYMGNSSEEKIYSTYITEGRPRQNNYGYSLMPVGYETGSGLKECRIYLGISKLPTLPANSVMVNAELKLRQHGFSYATGSSNKITVGIYEVGSEYTGSSVKSWIEGLTWSGRPAVSSSELLDYMVCSNGSINDDFRLNITRTVAKWYTRSTPAGGLELRKISEGNDPAYATMLGYTLGGGNEYEPLLSISYRSTVGLESYYSYRSAGAGRAGTLYVCDYSGQVCVVEGDVSYSTSAVSAGVSHIYNSSTDGVAGIGKGWRLNLHQTVRSVTYENTKYLVYTDADGTEHYFGKVGSEYRDEDGLGLRLSESGTNYSMSDADGYNTWTFTNGRLSGICDSNGNSQTIEYDSAGRVVRVYAKPDGGTQVKVAELSYNAQGYLVSVTDYRSQVTSYGYDAAGRLTEITHPDGTKASYGYDAKGYLSRLCDGESGRGLAVTYAENGYGRMVSSVREFAGAELYGGGFELTKPTGQLTEYRYYGVDHTANTSDDLRLSFVFDYAGRTICSYSRNSDGKRMLGASTASYTQNDGTSDKNNRMTASGSIGITNPVLSINGGFEGALDLTGSGWRKVTRSTLTNNQVHSGYNSVGLSANGGEAWVASPVTLESGKEYTFSCWMLNYIVSDWDADSYIEPILINSSGQAVTIPGVERSNTKTARSIDRGWERLSWTFTAPTGGSCRIGVKVSGCSGTVYIDDIQLEAGDSASSTNLVQNGKLQSMAWWNTGSGVSFDAATASPFGSGVLKLTGTPSVNIATSQTVYVYDNSRSTYILSGWGKATAVGATGTEYDGVKPYFGMIAAVKYVGESGEEWHLVPFNGDYNDWQYASGTVIPKKETAVEYIRVYLLYTSNGNTAYFDNIRLVQEPCASYSYDDRGNAVSATEGGAKSSCEYQSGTGLLTKYTAATGVEYSFTYEAGTHNVLTAQSAGVTSSNSYNAMGLATQTRTQGVNGWYQTTSSTYDTYGYLKTTTNTNGITTSRSYYNHFLTQIQSADLPAQEYRYNVANERLDNTFSRGYAILHYLYGSGRVSDIARKGKLGDSDIWQSSHFEYDAFGNVTRVGISGANNETAQSVGSTEYLTLATYSYDGSVNNGLLQSMSYGNGDSVSYSYDEYGRQIGQSYSEGLSYAYRYGTEGNLISQSSSLGERYTYDYDTLGRLIRSREYSGQELVQRTEHIYDEANRLMRQSWQNPGGEYTVSYSYLAANGLLGEMGIYLPGNLYSATSTSNTPDVKLSFTYDALNRLSRRTTVVNGTEQFYSGAWYAETAGGDGSQRTNQVKHYNYRVSATSDLIAGYQYAYDARGNISTETTTASGSVLSYTYDGQNQLTTVKNGSGTTLYSYSYDTMGNIRSKTDGSVTHLYTYGNSQWADLLTAYDGHTITYDGSGNPLSYYNGADYTFTWEQGRQLASVTKGNKTASYTYDMSGVRSSKTVNGVSYEYTTLSGKITRMTWSGNAVDIVYDDAGRPYILRYTPSGGATQTYYYVLNLQGDVVGLMNTSMQMVVKYSYDPWGKLTGTTATSAYVALAQANPLRYRSYCYDIETGFYYLQTRYYDPTIARFINADGYLTTDVDGLLSANMFAYCENNPIMGSDPTGSFITWDDVTGFLSDAGDWASDRIDDAIDWASDRIDDAVNAGKKLIGFGASVVNKIVLEGKEDFITAFALVTLKVGKTHNTIMASFGDSTKPFSLYVEGRSDNPMLSSVGARVNAFGFSYTMSLGLDNAGYTLSYRDGDTITSVGTRVNMSKLRAGIEWSQTTVISDTYSKTKYGNCSINGLGLLALYAVHGLPIFPVVQVA